MDARDKKFPPYFLAVGVRGLWIRLYALVIAPKSVLEDDRRKEFILNVILTSGLLLLLIFDVCILYDSVVLEADYHGISFVIFSIPILVLISLLVLSRLGYFRWSSYIILACFFAIIFYSARTWGMDLPAVLLGYALVVTASSILINTKFGIWVASAGILVLIYFGYREIQGISLPNHYWKSKVLRTDNVIEYSIMLFYLALISALSNSEIDKSLKRARSSELELKEERDNLEKTVEERTLELRQSQLERLAQHAQFVELGQLAGGYVHDLVNPLQTLSMSMYQLKSSGFSGASEALQLALNSSKRMENLLVTLRRQIRQDESHEWFSMVRELQEATQLLGYTAKAAGVEVNLNLPLSAEGLNLYGSPSRFHQIASNLISNAIESYFGLDIASAGVREVKVDLERFGGIVSLTVADSGSGIPEANLNRIFEPFFTTKNGSGLGIGLPTIKTIIEKDFHGSIRVFSQTGQGTKFTVTFPVQENH